VISSSHVVSAAPSSSLSSPAPAWGPPHGRQLFTNCPSVGPSHGVQSFRNRLLQCGSPRGHKPCSKPALAWAPLSMGPRVLPEACSGAGSPGAHSLLRTSPCSSVGSLPRAAGGDLLHRGPPWATGAQPASPCSVPWAAGESVPAPGAPPPPPSALALVSAELSLPHSLTPLS